MSINTPDTNIILIVDDSPIHLKVLSESLVNAGYEVAVAINGETALKQALYEPPDLILLDIQMPGMDGFETCQQLKAHPSTQAVPIIFMTALADTSSKIKGLKAGAVDYLTKPFQQEEVLARIKVHLQIKDLTQSLLEKNLLLDQLNHKLKHLVLEKDIQLQEADKLSSMGQMMAGITHEINNPLGFVIGNANQVEEFLQDLLTHLQLYQKFYPNPAVPIQNHAEEIDIGFLMADLPEMIASIKQGSLLIKEISTSMRIFAKVDGKNKVLFNIHDGMNSTLLILNHRLKANEHHPEIQVIKKYGKIPEIECFPGQLNQVFMNIIANAIDALEESNQGKTYAEIIASPNQITISTELTPDQTQVLIRIADNGTGIPEEICSQLFNPFFTTKPVGKGTGLGLSISYQIVVDKHQGKLECYSRNGQGTEFVIAIPVHAPKC
ncbi:response regulator [Lyngbya aestuarii BL J]|uniref:histidine kinase n=1 Tax=Lyngbya aestuarii BL J TaxID=1348334 RepID=U7QD86_9CYAN|nr:response regulator [Lyngbya aestuarii]ERT04686.1 response regulator [Lyngbya aestuarii BL J]